MMRESLDRHPHGLTIMSDASYAAHDFARFILSEEGQRILAGHGFSGSP